MSEMNMERRTFAKLAGAAGIGATAAAVSAASAVRANAEEAPASGQGLTTTDVLDKTWAFEVPPAPIPQDQIVDSQEAEVVVVGAGTAGLVTAMSALDTGLSVILISASGAPVSRGGSNNACYSKVMEEMGIPRYDLGDFTRLQLLATSGKINERTWYSFFNNSETAMNWLVDKMAGEGVKCTVEVTAGYEYPDPMWDPPSSHCFYVEDSELDGSIGSGQHYVVDALAKLVDAHERGSVQFNMTAEQLVREDDNTGRVTSVVARDAEGAYHRYDGAKAIVLATGDFSLDRDMMAKYCPDMVRFLKDNELDYGIGSRSGGLMPGDGQKMGLWVGAAWQKTYPVEVMCGSQFPANQPYACHWGLVVNANGERYMNEDVLGSIATAGLLRQPGNVAYCIWDSAYADEIGTWNKDKCCHGAVWDNDALIENWKGRYSCFDTLEEVIADLGLPESTLETIEHYNELCRNGEDTDFHKSASKLFPIATPPFFGGSKGVSMYTTLGGLRTNEHLQVCDADDQPIPGLFNVGSMIGDFYSNWYTYALEGENYGACCVTLPYVLGQELGAGLFE